jgi:hypothetical protein
VRRKDPVPLPDLDDETFKARLQPLAHRVVPAAKPSAAVGAEQEQRPRDQETPNTRIMDFQSSNIPEFRNSGAVEAARRLERLRQARGEKQRFEFVLPVRVGRALAEEGRRSGMSATRKLLEILRDAGLPVLEEDLLDLRKEKRR